MCVRALYMYAEISGASEARDLKRCNVLGDCMSESDDGALSVHSKDDLTDLDYQVGPPA